MKCRAITKGYNDGRTHSATHACTYAAVQYGLCRVHLKHRDLLPGMIAASERRTAALRARLAALDMPPVLENPS